MGVVNNVISHIYTTPKETTNHAVVRGRELLEISLTLIKQFLKLRNIKSLEMVCGISTLARQSYSLDLRIPAT